MLNTVKYAVIITVVLASMSNTNTYDTILNTYPTAVLEIDSSKDCKGVCIAYLRVCVSVTNVDNPRIKGPGGLESKVIFRSPDPVPGSGAPVG